MKTRLNLLPWRVRRSQIVRRRLIQWTVAWAMVAGVTAGLCLAKANQRAEAQEALTRLEDEYAPIAAVRNQIQSCRKSLEAWNRREAAAAQLEDSRPALTLVGMVSRSARVCQGRLRIDLLTVRPRDEASRAAEKKPAEKQKTPTPAGSPSATVTIKGAALDNLAVSRFVAALRETKAFDRVELKSSAEQPIGDVRTCSYQVECSY